MTSRLPPLSRFFPSRHTSLDNAPRKLSTCTFIEHDYPYNDTSAEESPQPDQATPQIPTTCQNPPLSFVSGETLPSNKITHFPPLSPPICMFPTPFASHAGSEYEPSPPQVTHHPTHPQRPSREFHRVPATSTALEEVAYFGYVVDCYLIHSANAKRLLFLAR